MINHVYVTLGVFLGFYETFSFSYMLRRAKHFRTIFIYFKRHFFLLRCNLKTKITQFINPDLIANSEKLNTTKSICAIEMYDMQRKTNKLKIKTRNIHAKHVLRSAITYFNASHKKKQLIHVARDVILCEANIFWCLYLYSGLDYCFARK